MATKQPCGGRKGVKMAKFLSYNEDERRCWSNPPHWWKLGTNHNRWLLNSTCCRDLFIASHLLQTIFELNIAPYFLIVSYEYIYNTKIRFSANIINIKGLFILYVTFKPIFMKIDRDIITCLLKKEI